jgi:phospholipid/cholesterol/gamma-HCH transport system substrate-binding protein
MATQRTTEIRVGIFLLVGLALVGGLILKYGKYESAGKKTYDIGVVFPSVGGIVQEASVMYAGITIGKVKNIQHQENGKMQARLTLALYKGNRVRRDAKFVINQSGLLGDRYVDVVPMTATAPYIEPGETVNGSTSVDFTEAIRSAVEILHQARRTIEQVETAVQRIDGAVQRVDEGLLNTQNLNRVTATLENIQITTSNAVALTTSLRDMIAESRGGVSNTLAKLSLAADNVNTLSKRVDNVVVDNQDDIRMAVKNLATSAQRLNAIMDRLDKGEGSVGKILVDSTLHDELVTLVQNWRRYGLLHKEGTRKGGDPKRGLTPVPARPSKDWKPPAGATDGTP